MSTQEAVENAQRRYRGILVDETAPLDSRKDVSSTAETNWSPEGGFYYPDFDNQVTPPLPSLRMLLTSLGSLVRRSLRVAADMVYSKEIRDHLP